MNEAEFKKLLAHFRRSCNLIEDLARKGTCTEMTPEERKRLHQHARHLYGMLHALLRELAPPDDPELFLKGEHENPIGG